MDTADPKFLLEKAKQGDQAAFDLLYQQFLTPIYRYIILRVKDKNLAEDLSQTVFLKVYQSLDKISGFHKTPLAYFFTVARNTVIDHFRKNKLQLSDNPEDEISHISDPHPNPEEQYVKLEVSEKIKKAISLLTEDQQEIIILKFINGFTNPEISAMTGKSEEAIRQLQSRAIKAMRKRINPL